jgi:sec-independent protein translocase protein TatA
MKSFSTFTVLATVFSTAFGFAPVHTPYQQQQININSLQQSVPTHSSQLPIVIQKQRHSMSQVQTMSLFGLGGPELAIILIAGAFLLGPEKLAELGKDAGKIAGELKEVPKEFQKGLEEGEKQALETKNEIAADMKKSDE